MIIILNKKFKALKIKRNFDFQIQHLDDGEDGLCDYNPYTSQMNRRMELMEVMKRQEE